MPSWQRDVFSSMVSSIGWEGDDALSGTLTVKWAKGGKTSAYFGVPEDVAIQLSKSPSVGSMINSDIKGQYGHSYV